jgi:hypothetical protein
MRGPYRLRPGAERARVSGADVRALGDQRDADRADDYDV